MVGVDETGYYLRKINTHTYNNRVHVVEVNGSGQVQECLGGAIGSRCQSAKTYLEKEYQYFPSCSREALILHGLRALRDTVQQDKEMEFEGVSIGMIGLDEKFCQVDAIEIERLLASIKDDVIAVRVEEVEVKAEVEVNAEVKVADNVVPVTDQMDTN